MTYAPPRQSRAECAKCEQRGAHDALLKCRSRSDSRFCTNLRRRSQSPMRANGAGPKKCAYRTRVHLPLHRPHSAEVRTQEEAVRALRLRIRIATHEWV